MMFKVGDKVTIKKELWEYVDYYGIYKRHMFDMPLVCTISFIGADNCRLNECPNGYVWGYKSLTPLSKSDLSPSLLLFLE